MYDSFFHVYVSTFVYLCVCIFVRCVCVYSERKSYVRGTEKGSCIWKNKRFLNGTKESMKDELTAFK